MDGWMDGLTFWYRIMKQILAIKRSASPSDSVAPVGLLTAENRTTWAEARQILEQTEQNRTTLEAIDKALFMVCLDDSSPTTIDDAGRRFFHGGDGTNRWFDKTFSVVCWSAPSTREFDWCAVTTWLTHRWRYL
jgi:carnitine O-acetyltransferase